MAIPERFLTPDLESALRAEYERRKPDPKNRYF
jgi:hypothetical protein